MNKSEVATVLHAMQRAAQFTHLEPRSSMRRGFAPTRALAGASLRIQGVFAPALRAHSDGYGLVTQGQIRPTPTLPTSGEGVISPPPRRGGGREGDPQPAAPSTRVPMENLG
ncbi:MAG: hypothetical protein B7Z79_08035 [Thiomonas sp. 20-64-9]|nr:MAG: hypothetical protein B7Z79_08035 [Thiomonas sp. 20-64-9]OZB70142.1 MAG: hypothetical protein B7X30_10080 [Thiomonas sp. 13-64-67]